MDYILMHKDNEVAYVKNGFELTEIIDKEHMPIGIYRENLDIRFADSRFKTWLSHRTIPNNRVFGELLKKATGCEFSDLMLKSMAVSLTDTYWLKPTNTELIWKDINFHDALFSNNISQAILSRDERISADEAHPTFTTDGMLEKTWVLINNMPYLLKFDESGKQTAGEVYASRAAQILGVDHVPYNHIKTAGRHACVCPCCITDADTDMVYAMQYKWLYNCGDRELYDYLAKKDADGLDRMIAFDALTYQYDRHLYNFAYAGNKLLPLYDSGRCLVSSDETLPFCRTRKEQLGLIKNIPFEIPDISLLTGIYEEVCNEFDIEPDTRDKATIKRGINDLQERKVEIAKNKRRGRIRDDRSDTIEWWQIRAEIQD